MTALRRVVFDTSTLVGAALKINSVPHRALLEVLARCDLCASAQTWLELELVMQRKRFDAYLPASARRDFVALVRQHLHFFAVTSANEVGLSPPCRDPKDNKFLALAQVCQADALVSSDADLCSLNPWNGVPILSAAALLDRFAYRPDESSP